MSKESTFTSVAGQTVTVGRPPDGYVVVADTRGVYRFVSKHSLLCVPLIGEIVVRAFESDLMS